jgi:hypothetical protein
MKDTRTHLVLLFFITLITLLSFSCRSTYYAAWEKLGKEKRHLLKDNIEKAQTEQEEAQESFKDVLTRMKELYGFKGGDLEAFYNKLKDDYETCEGRAIDVKDRIKQVEQIASDLFIEWETEIREIKNTKLKSRSQSSLRDARQRYKKLESAMKGAQAKMNPVLAQLKDYVLFLKHNLNAQAIGTLRQEVGEIEVEVEGLIRDIQKSIQEADSFLKNFK